MEEIREQVIKPILNEFEKDSNSNIMQLGKEFVLRKYEYGCDRGSVRLVTNNGTELLLNNDIGDGDYTLYIMRVPGWGPAMYKDNLSYEAYETFIENWTEYSITIGDTEDIKWTASFFDIGYSDGVELKSDYIKCYHRWVPDENTEDEYEGDAQVLIICYGEEK